MLALGDGNGKWKFGEHILGHCHFAGIRLGDQNCYCLPVDSAPLRPPCRE